MADGELTSCPVCFDDYTVDLEDHVPRILPCHHTLCSACLGRVLGGRKSLVCPECRLKHRAPAGVRTFPQNKYIVGNLNRKPPPPDKVVQEKPKKKKRRFDRCKEHGMKLNIFCYDKKCQKSICQVCLMKTHRFHEVVDIKEEIQTKVMTLNQDITKVKDALESMKVKLVQSKKELKKRSKACLVELQAKKAEHLKLVSERYDELVKEIQDELKHPDIDEDIINVNKQIEILEKINQNINPKKVVREKLEGARLTVNSIAQNVTLNLTEANWYRFFRFTENGFSNNDIKRSCGDLARQFEPIYPEDPNHYAMKIEPVVPGGPTVRSEVIQTVLTQCSQMHYVAVLNDCIALCGMIGEVYGLVYYDLQTGGESWTFPLPDTPSGMALVNLNGTPCIAFCYLNGNIEVIDRKNKTLRWCSIKQHQPATMTSFPPCGLIYVDISKRPRDIAWLDWTSSPPTLSITRTQAHTIRGQCCVETIEGNTVVLACGVSGLKAYNSQTDKLEWSYKGAVPGCEAPLNAISVATDGCGRLFLVDSSNNCIHMFSMDGVYSGRVVTEGGSISTPLEVRWSKELSALILVHQRKSLCISVLMFN